MKADLRDAPATNGTHRAPKKSRPAPKPPAEQAEPIAAPFAVTEAVPVDTEKWLLHFAMWFQPERAPSVSPWTGLSVERRNRIPAPTFAQPIATPLDCPGGAGVVV